MSNFRLVGLDNFRFVEVCILHVTEVEDENN